MRFTNLVEWGWCGFGRSKDLIPEIRLGIVRLAWCRGSLLTRLFDLRDDLRAARDEIRRLKGL